MRKGIGYPHDGPDRLTSDDEYPEVPVVGDILLEIVGGIPQLSGSINEKDPVAIKSIYRFYDHLPVFLDETACNLLRAGKKGPRRRNRMAHEEGGGEHLACADPYRLGGIHQDI